MKMYIAIFDEFPDYMVPTLVAHTVLGAHLEFSDIHSDTSGWRDGEYYYPRYMEWLKTSFKKCVVRVNQKEFDKILALQNIFVGRENSTLDGKDSCIIVCPMPDNELPNVLKFAKLWKPSNC